jgi:hypothetical protein
MGGDKDRARYKWPNHEGVELAPQSHSPENEKKKGENKKVKKQGNTCIWNVYLILSTHIFVWDDFDTLHMASCFKDLLQNVLGDSAIQATNIKSSLVWLRSSATHITTSAGRGHHVA